MAPGVPKRKRLRQLHVLQVFVLLLGLLYLQQTQVFVGAPREGGLDKAAASVMEDTEARPGQGTGHLWSQRAWLAPTAAAVAVAAWASGPEVSAALPPAPSGINVLPEGQQGLVVLAILAALGLLTWFAVSLVFPTVKSLLPEGWFAGWQKTWPLLGAVYMAAGVAHFTAAAAFESIYPPAGTWGIWYLPGSAQFHVAWTGVAEILGGAGLFIGALGLGAFALLGKEPPEPLKAIPGLAALGLFFLTIAVTPANIYMYTHGAQMTGLTPGDQPIPVEFHAVRGFFQVVLLSLLWGYYATSREKGRA